MVVILGFRWRLLLRLLRMWDLGRWRRGGSIGKNWGLKGGGAGKRSLIYSYFLWIYIGDDGSWELTIVRILVFNRDEFRY